MTERFAEPSGAHIPMLDLTVIDCPDAEQLARFYSGVLSWEVEEGSNRDWATLAPPGGGVSPDNPDGRAALAFQPSEDGAFRVFHDPAGHSFCLIR